MFCDKVANRTRAKHRVGCWGRADELRQPHRLSSRFDALQPELTDNSRRSLSFAAFHMLMSLFVAEFCSSKLLRHPAPPLYALLPRLNTGGDSVRGQHSARPQPNSTGCRCYFNPLYQQLGVFFFLFCSRSHLLPRLLQYPPYLPFFTVARVDTTLPISRARLSLSARSPYLQA